MQKTCTKSSVQNFSFNERRQNSFQTAVEVDKCTTFISHWIHNYWNRTEKLCLCRASTMDCQIGCEYTQFQDTILKITRMTLRRFRLLTSRSDTKIVQESYLLEAKLLYDTRISRSQCAKEFCHTMTQRSMWDTVPTRSTRIELKILRIFQPRLKIAPKQIEHGNINAYNNGIFIDKSAP